MGGPGAPKRGTGGPKEEREDKRKREEKKRKRKKKEKKRSRSILIDHLSYIFHTEMLLKKHGVWRCELWIDYALKSCHYLAIITYSTFV